MGKKWVSDPRSLWSGARLARASALSQNYLAKRLRDELPFTLNDIERIAKALDVDYSVLLLCDPALAHERESDLKPHQTESTK